jgi:peptidyl-dipeptidase A
MPRVILIALCLSSLVSVARAQGAATADAEFTKLHDAYLAKFKPLTLEAEAAWWEANITGTDAAYERKRVTDKALVDLHSDHEMFAQLKALKEKGEVRDPVLRRELDVMYRAFLPGQADPKLQKQIVDLENDVEQTFNTHRGQVGDKTLSENDIRDILATTTDSAQAEAAWKAYMEVGAKVDGKLRELARLRNQVARELGFRDYFAMSLVLQEIEEDKLFNLFDELDSLTFGTFAKVKADMDATRAARFHVAVSELRPWHFGDLFFQEAPGGEGVNLDDLFKNADMVALAKKYYASIGLPVDDILAHSDLYEKPGKCPHAFCADLNRAGDIRVLANVKPNLYWAGTILHELGHGVYDKNIRADVPFVLHEASHAITTEGIAEMFGALVKNEEWLTKVLGIAPDEAARVGRAARESLRIEQLMFSRWTQVMLRFEQGLYKDPNQDLGRLWSDLRKRYQLLNSPEPASRPDYAAKMHILTHPVYYQCYMMGELFAAQVKNHVARKVLGLKDARQTSFYEQPKAGEFLRENIFGPGDEYSWAEITQRATGEPLTARYFVDDFVSTPDK